MNELWRLRRSEGYEVCEDETATSANNLTRRNQVSMKYVCDICGYVYDPEVGDPDNGVAPGTPWEEVPEDWTCPLCSVGKDQFSPEE